MRKQEGRKSLRKEKTLCMNATGERRNRTLTYSLSSGSFQTMKFSNYVILNYIQNYIHEHKIYNFYLMHTFAENRLCWFLLTVQRLRLRR